MRPGGAKSAFRDSGVNTRAYDRDVEMTRVPGPVRRGSRLGVEADGSAVRGAPPLREEVVGPQRTIKGKENTHSSPFSIYSAPGGLPQDPGHAA